LRDQASTLSQLLHANASFPEGSRVLEVGCGVGAQTLTLAANNPRARITAIDISEESVHEARRAVQQAGLRNVEFARADIFDLPFAPRVFDHVFVCFVLEHLDRPVEALRALQSMLAPGGEMNVIEGDHGSTFFHPDSDFARAVIRCQVELQARAGGDARLGRRLYPLLRAAGFKSPRVVPRVVYVDGSRPDWAEGFTRKTFAAMIEGIRAPALEAGLVSSADFDMGIRDLLRAGEADGVFCYTFFEAIAKSL
jgi:SAM-dependent methyltransferase